jgi:REP element-mobilizing transposase RayT
MAEKFNNKYRTTSHRKPGWDYSSDGHYFITIVVQSRLHLLGNVSNKQMILNPWGEIIQQEWIKSFELRNELFCDVFVLMPNHLHAIVTIDNGIKTQNGKNQNLPRVQTHGRAAVLRNPKSISSFIGGFKSAINTAIDNAIDAGVNLFPDLGKFNKKNHFWQPDYHDHVIRDEPSYNRIFHYTENNPTKWGDDIFH